MSVTALLSHNEVTRTTNTSESALHQSIRLGVSVSVHCIDEDVVTVTGAPSAAALAVPLSFQVHRLRRPARLGAGGVPDKHRLMKINAGSSCFTALDRPTAARDLASTVG